MVALIDHEMSEASDGVVRHVAAFQALDLGDIDDTARHSDVAADASVGQHPKIEKDPPSLAVHCSISWRR